MRNFVILLFMAVVTAVILALPSPSSHASPTISLTSWQMEGDQAAAEYGYAVAMAGDVNGDGYDDFLVGAPRYNNGIYREGAAFLFLGGAGGPAATPDWRSSSGQSGSRYGAALAGVGDVNSDGYDDILIGAPEYKGGQTHTGAAYLFLGSASGLAATPDWITIYQEADADYGVAVAAAGDINQDGYDDALVGAGWADVAGNNAGAVYVYLGTAVGLETTSAVTVTMAQPGSGFGMSLSGAGDVNLDGYDDVLVGAPYTTVGDVENAGEAYLFLGRNDGLATAPVWQMAGSQKNEQFGTAVSRAGDINQDGYVDILIGAPQHTIADEAVGAAYSFYGRPSGFSTTPDWAVTGDELYSALGTAVSGAGDVNQDGYADVLIGIPYGEVDQRDEGVIHLYLGNAAGLPTTPQFIAAGNKAETMFGNSLSGGSDINQDGAADFLVGAPQYKQDEHTILGQITLFYGQQTGITPHHLYLPIIYGSE